MPRTIALLLLTALLATGCGDDDPDTATIEEMRVVKVSGDQAAQVPPPEVAGLRITAVVGEDGWTDEPLIARIVTTGGGGAQATITGLSADVVPAGTLVHWYLPEECGRLFAQTTATDDSAYTANRWAPGTRSGTCHARAGRLVGTQIVMDTTWVLEVLPGPVAEWSLGYNGRQELGTCGRIESRSHPTSFAPAGAQIDFAEFIVDARDAYYNKIDGAALREDSATVQWAINPYTEGEPTAPEFEGWTVSIPTAPGDYWMTAWLNGLEDRTCLRVQSP